MIAPVALAIALQQPVQGGTGRRQQHFSGGGAGQLLAAAFDRETQPGGRLAGGGRQVQLGCGLQGQMGRQHRHHRAGFAGAGSAANQHQPLGQQRGNGPLLGAIKARRRRPVTGSFHLGG